MSGPCSAVYKDDVLKGKVAFITGGASGICKGIAESFMRHGADVAIVSRKQERLDVSARELMAAVPGRKCIGVAADVRKGQEVENALRKTLSEFGRLDIVVNGAAGNFLCPIASLSYNAFRTVMEIDTMGTFNVSKAAFEAYLRDHGGIIINITATLHYTGHPLQVHVGAAKAGVDAITKHCAVEWGPCGIRVNGIAPGAIEDTEGFRRLAPKDVAQQKQLASFVPLQRMGKIDDICAAALYLATDASLWMSGHTLVVDGGSWMVGHSTLLSRM